MKKILFFAIATLLLLGCTKENGSDVNTENEIITLQAKNIFYNNAVIQGQYNPSSLSVNRQGFVFSDHSITTSNQGTEYFSKNVVSGIFSMHVKDLQKNTDYYVKAFIERSTGEKVYGREIKFTTDSLIILTPGKPVGSANAIDGRTVAIQAQATTLGNEGLTANERKIANLKLADVGIYYWPKNEDETKAMFFSIGEDVASAIADPASKTTFNLTGLDPSTEYKCRLSIKTMVSYNSDKWKSYSEEVKGDELSFNTLDLVAPAATTLEPADITPTSFTAYGMLDSNGYDPLTRYGFEYWANDDENNRTIVYSKSLSSGMIQLFSVFVQNLDPQKTYSCRAFAENELERAFSNSTKTLTTKAPGVPVVNDYPYLYDFRVQNFTSTKLCLRAKMLSDGGSAVTSKGFYWGTSPEALNNKIEVADEVAFDDSFYYFGAELTSDNTIVYYKPFAVNSRGESVCEEVFSACTAIKSEKNLFRFDASLGLIPSFNNMVETDVELIYYELDPIITSVAKYYILDRNLGATRTYDISFYDKSFKDASTYPSLFDAAGYYFQFDRPIPSATPDIKVTTTLEKSPYNWSRNPDLFANPEMNTVGPTWEQKVCPEGYDLPTREEITDIIETLQPNEADRTLVKLFPYTFFGTTGSRTPANGNMLNNTDPTVFEIWLKDGHPAKADANIMRLKTPPTGTFVLGTANRYSARPVRCIRKEIIN